MKIIFLLLCLMLLACQQHMTAEMALKSYITDRLEGRIKSKEEVLSRLTGKYWSEINALTVEEFNKMDDFSKIKKEGFRIISEKCMDKKCFITYSFSYSTMESEKKVYTSEVKKVAELIQEDKSWKIAEVNTIKSFHDLLEPITPETPVNK